MKVLARHVTTILLLAGDFNDKDLHQITIPMIVVVDPYCIMSFHVYTPALVVNRRFQELQFV